MAEKQIIIKKYSNRRLYDTVHKRYVTLDEIAELIKQGNEIKVIDSQTDEDITRVILIQVILEGEKNNADILPTSFLHMLIKYGNRMARDFFENYFLFMFQPYLSFQENMKSNLRWWQGTGWFPSGKVENPWQMFTKDLGKRDEDANGSEETPSISSSMSPPMMEMQVLFERIKELEDEVKSIKSRKGREKNVEK